MKLPVIIVVAFNRADSLKALLESLTRAWYPVDRGVDLVISVDGGGSEDVIELANGFEWAVGLKQVLVREANLGLKQHILTCGALGSEKGDFVLLEDDLLLSPNFYAFASGALDFYREVPGLAGISLYNYQVTESRYSPFQPLEDEWEVYFLQLPSSWGFCCTAEQWKGFSAWLERMHVRPETGPGPMSESGQETDFGPVPGSGPGTDSGPVPEPVQGTDSGPEAGSGRGTDSGPVPGSEPVLAPEQEATLPQYIQLWPRSSWKKLWMTYVLEKDLLFVYPRVALSTNCGTEGTHFQGENPFQVPLQMGKRNFSVHPFRFGLPDQSIALYDSFYELRPEAWERLGLDWWSEYRPEADVYGSKEPAFWKSEWLLTTRDAKSAKLSFGLELWPAELNLMYGIPGQKIRLVKRDWVRGTRRDPFKNYYRYEGAAKYVLDGAFLEWMKARKIEAGLPRVSIIIPWMGYGELESAVSRTLENVFESEYPRLEVFLAIEDPFRTEGGQSGPGGLPMEALEMKVVEGLQERFPSLKVIKMPAGQLLRAGLEIGHGEFFCWLTPGAILVPDCLEKVATVFSRFREVNVLSGIPVSGSDGARLAKWRWNSSRFRKASIKSLAEQFGSGNLFVRKHALQQGLDNLRLHFPFPGGRGENQGNERISGEQFEEGASQGASLQGMSSRGATSQGASLQGMSSRGATSQEASLPGMSSRGATSQEASLPGMTSRGMTSQETTSQGRLSQKTTSQGASSREKSSEKGGSPRIPSSGDALQGGAQHAEQLQSFEKISLEQQRRTLVQESLEITLAVCRDQDLYLFPEQLVEAEAPIKASFPEPQALSWQRQEFRKITSLNRLLAFLTFPLYRADIRGLRFFYLEFDPMPPVIRWREAVADYYLSRY